MAKLSHKVGKKATKATVRHSAHGLASKAKRRPLRSVSLLSAGGIVGAVVGWFAGRKTASPKPAVS
jgi:hypothetical protein